MSPSYKSSPTLCVCVCVCVCVRERQVCKRARVLLRFESKRGTEHGKQGNISHRKAEQQAASNGR